MNKILTCFISLSLALSLCSCMIQKEDEPGRETPESVPELESIVEPVTGEKESGDIEAESEDADSTGGESAIADAPPSGIDETESDDTVISVPESVPEAEPESSVSEMYGAVARSNRLDGGEIEKELLRLINTLRDEAGVNSLGIEDSMQFAARIRAAEALESFSHTRPDGMPYNTAFDEAGFSYTGKWHGENLSSLSFSEGMFDEKEIALEMFKGLRNSPGHYRNMTEINFLQAGVGVAILYSESTVDVASAQMFSSL